MKQRKATQKMDGLEGYVNVWDGRITCVQIHQK